MELQLIPCGISIQSFIVLLNSSQDIHQLWLLLTSKDQNTWIFTGTNILAPSWAVTIIRQSSFKITQFVSTFTFSNKTGSGTKLVSNAKPHWVLRRSYAQNFLHIQDVTHSLSINDDSYLSTGQLVSCSGIHRALDVMTDQWGANRKHSACIHAIYTHSTVECFFIEQLLVLSSLFLLEAERSSISKISKCSQQKD